jgi:hypothetical protein
LALQLNLVLKRKLIENVPLFKDVTPMAMIGLVHRLQSTIALPNQVLLRQGEYGDRMYFITKGLLTVYIDGAAEAPPKIVAELHNGYSIICIHSTAYTVQHTQYSIHSTAYTRHSTHTLYLQYIIH